MPGVLSLKTGRALALFALLDIVCAGLGMGVPILCILFGVPVDPAADLANFGIPLILYEPRASFVGWVLLMIVIAPFSQFLMTRFGAHLAVWRWLPSGGGNGEERDTAP